LRFGYGSAFKLTTSFRTAIDTLIALGQMHPFMLKDQAEVVKELCNEMELREDPS
jgi:hypothetical protein